MLFKLTVFLINGKFAGVFKSEFIRELLPKVLSFRIQTFVLQISYGIKNNFLKIVFQFIQLADFFQKGCLFGIPAFQLARYVVDKIVLLLCELLGLLFILKDLYSLSFNRGALFGDCLQLSTVTIVGFPVESCLSCLFFGGSLLLAARIRLCLQGDVAIVLLHYIHYIYEASAGAFGRHISPQT